MTKHFLMHLCMVIYLCLLMLFSGCKDIGSLFKAKYQRTEHTSVPIAGVRGLNVESEVGSITVTGADVTDCNITAEITVKAQSQEKAQKLADEVGIEHEFSDDTLTIKAVKPAELKKRALVVDFKIIVPMHMKLNCSNDVGTLTISDIEGRIDASVNVGSINCHAVVAQLDLSSNVGSISVKYKDAAPAACEANVKTNIGSISFTPPSELSAQIHASTNVGSVNTTKPITFVGKIDKSIQGTVGSGEGKITLRTNVGSIAIK